MSTVLNLARKWRSKSFDQMVGQALPIRMLKNSLYLESFFPVYLFSGQRGCGKTSMARIFASAVNCEKLPDFQKNPKIIKVPCLECASCIAMANGQHPDFIEIDAASYTGVDNVRQIVDASSFLPVMGRKKIYLIDEVHMLSKAAFNAFLKVMEEPTSSVLFILATTDPQKILDTVKSRCFHVFFTPVDAPSLSNHLAAICQAENINFDQAGLDLIVKTTEGSARDAINLLEQVRFSTSNVTKQAVLNVLGHLDDERLVALFKILLFGGVAELLRYMKAQNVASYSAEFVWNKLNELIRAALWIKHGVEPQHFIEHLDVLKRMVQKCPVSKLHELLDVLYAHENSFLKTTAQHGLLEIILLKMCQKNNVDDNSGSSTPQNASAADVGDAAPVGHDLQDEGEDVEDEDEEEVEGMSVLKPWQNFLYDVEALQDPLLNSVFKQGICVRFNDTSKILEVAFSKELILFKDWLDGAARLWQPLLQKYFGGTATLKPLFTLENKTTDMPRKVATPFIKIEVSRESFVKKNVSEQPVNKEQSYKKNYVAPFNSGKKYGAPSEQLNPRIDVSDATVWKKATMILQYFPGTVREFKESAHEQKS
ncbi:MAG: DNA polymerase III subunit gamma/tau [Candidatus Dependentiae bacterium]|nr:DNA polymerase III subunit gamma/tau [Candidatus Dependentiae bacterium]